VDGLLGEYARVMPTPTDQRLRLLPEFHTVSLVDSSADAPLLDNSWRALVRAPEGLTVIRVVGPDAGGPRWRAFYGDTAHGLDVPGMLAAILVPLAGAGVPVFVASTFHADLVLVPVEAVDTAVDALRTAGFEVG
jgi:hypothetical protein